MTRMSAPLPSLFSPEPSAAAPQLRGQAELEGVSLAWDSAPAPAKRHRDRLALDRCQSHTGGCTAHPSGCGVPPLADIRFPPGRGPGDSDLMQPSH